MNQPDHSSIPDMEDLNVEDHTYDSIEDHTEDYTDDSANDSANDSTNDATNEHTDDHTNEHTNEHIDDRTDVHTDDPIENHPNIMSDHVSQNADQDVDVKKYNDIDKSDETEETVMDEMDDSEGDNEDELVVEIYSHSLMVRLAQKTLRYLIVQRTTSTPGGNCAATTGDSRSIMVKTTPRLSVEDFVRLVAFLLLFGWLGENTRRHSTGTATTTTMNVTRIDWKNSQWSANGFASFLGGGPFVFLHFIPRLYVLHSIIIIHSICSVSERVMNISLLLIPLSFKVLSLWKD